MERDFLGINAQDSGPPPMEDGRGSRQDSVYVGSSAVQWPFLNKTTAMQQQFVSFKQHEERPKKIVFDQFSSGFQPISTVDAFEASHKSSPALAPQKSFSIDRQGVHQYSMHVYQPQGLSSSCAEPRMFPVVSHHSVPVVTSSPFFKVQGAPSGPSLPVTSLKQQSFGGGLAVSAPVGASVVGAIAQRNVTKPASTTAQLTIFYAGSVNVYDDIPLDKAQAIMLLASKGSNATSNAISNAVNPRSEAPPAPTKVAGSDGLSTNQNTTPTLNHVASPRSGLSSPLSVTSQTGPHTGSGSTTNDDTSVVKTVGLLAPTSKNEPSKALTAALGSTSAETIMPRAVPQARKASLARFLEKRKERVTTALPYPCIKKSLENAAGFEGANTSSKSSSVDIALSSNREDSWCLGQQRNTADSGESPSTKLEI